MPGVPSLADRREKYRGQHQTELVSVVMPSFNQARFISRSIESVLGQSYTNLELIVMDGGSTDDTIEILESYAEKDSRLHWKTERDKGPGDALNKALNRTRGTIIGWLNSDDLYVAGAVERAVNGFAEMPDLLMHYGEGIYIDENDEALNVYPTKPPSVGIDAFKDGCFICQPAVFFKKSMHIMLGPLDENQKTSFDYEYWLRAFKAFPDRIGFISEVQALSRLHEDCITSKQRELVAIEGIRLVSRYLGRSAVHWFYTYVDETLAEESNERISAATIAKLADTLLKVEHDLSQRDLMLANKVIENLANG